MLKPGVVRIILALTVVAFHISKLLPLGEFAVLSFFMLSGYWITLMYENKYSKSSVVNFYVSRFWRLLPVFILFNAITILLKSIYDHQVFLSLMANRSVGFYLSNIFILGLNTVKRFPLAPAWSLDLELQYYLLFPLLYMIFKKKDIFLYIIAALSFIVLIIHTLLVPVTEIPTTVFPLLFFFIVGMVIFLKKLTFSARTELIFNGMFFFILLLIYCIPVLRAHTLKDPYCDFNHYLNTALPLFLIPFFSNSVRRKSDQTDRAIGEMSFVLYLAHWALIAPYNYYSRDLSFVQRLPYTIGYLVITLGLSYLLFRFYDKPIDNLRRKWVESKIKGPQEKHSLVKK